MPQPTIRAASCEYSSTRAKRPLAAGPSNLASAMSVAKIRTARPNRVTTVTNASRSSVEDDDRGALLAASAGVEASPTAAVFAADADADPVGSIIGRSLRARCRRGADHRQLRVTQRGVEPRNRPIESLVEADRGAVVQDLRRLGDAGDVARDVARPRGCMVDRDRLPGGALDGSGELVDRRLASRPDLEELSRDRRFRGVERGRDGDAEVIDMDEVTRLGSVAMDDDRLPG